jgi:hypothetical protein
MSSYAEKLEELQRLRTEVRRLEAAAETQAKSMSPLTESDERKMSADQASYDPAYTAVGRRAPPPLGHERPREYVRRLAGGLQPLSARWKPVDIASLADGTFEIASAQIRSDALAAGPTAGLAPGQMKAIDKSDGLHRVIEFVGNDCHFTEQFRRAPRQAIWINEGRSDRGAPRPEQVVHAYPTMVQAPRASF